MPSEKRSRIEKEKLVQDGEATPKPPTLKQNIVLSLKLLIGGAALLLLLWYLDSYVSK